MPYKISCFTMQIPDMNHVDIRRWIVYTLNCDKLEGF